MSDESTRIRLRQTFEMAELGLRLMRQTLRRRFPNATEAELGEKYAEWITNRPLMTGTDLKAIPLQQPQRQLRRRTARDTRRAS